MSERPIGSVGSLHRYPVKSMQGEALTRAELDRWGVVGDRGHALLSADGRVVTAKRTNELLRFAAGFGDVADPGPVAPTIRCPDGSSIEADSPAVSARISDDLGRDVTLVTRDAGTDSFGELDAETIFAGVPIAQALAGKARQLPDDADRYGLAQGTFFDSAHLHLLTTGTLAHLATLIEGVDDLDVRRFRPNVLIETDDGLDGFVEDEWIGARLRIGDDVVVHEIWPTLRCVMTTAAQPGIERDLRVLKTIVREHETNLGAFAAVERAGIVRVGDPVVLVT